MLSVGTPVFNEFRSGNLNSLPVYVLAQLWKFVGWELNLQEIIILGRWVMPLILGAATCALIYTASFIWLKSIPKAFLIGVLWLSSPYIASQSLIWYPDSYIAFFSALVLVDLSRYVIQEKPLKSKKDLIKASILIALGTSIKYNFLIFTIPYLLVLKSQKSGRLQKNKKNLQASYGQSVKYAALFVVMIFTIINYSVLLRPLDFLRAVNGNRKIYQFDIERLSGGMTYLWDALVLPLGIAGSVILIFGTATIAKSQRSVFHIFIAPIAIYLFIGGLNNHIVVRNINIVTPFLLVPVLYLFRKNQNNRSTLLILTSAIIFVLGINSIKSFENYNQLQSSDSTKQILLEISQYIPKSETVGINRGCSGPMPIEAIGYKVYEDPAMATGLEYYLFTSYYESRIFPYYSQGYISSSKNLKDAHFYYYNKDVSFKFNSTKQKLSSFLPAGYKVEKIFRGNGPEFILIKKDSSLK